MGYRVYETSSSGAGRLREVLYGLANSMIDFVNYYKPYLRLH